MGYVDPAVLMRHFRQHDNLVSSAEQVKKWTILPRDFLQEQDELTPTLKVRRRAIIGKYADDIEALYS